MRSMIVMITMIAIIQILAQEVDKPVDIKIHIINGIKSLLYLSIKPLPVEENAEMMIVGYSGSGYKMYNVTEEVPENSTNIFALNNIWIEGNNYMEATLTLRFVKDDFLFSLSIFICICHRFCIECIPPNNKNDPIPTDTNPICSVCNENFQEDLSTPGKCTILKNKELFEEAVAFEKFNINIYDPQDPFFTDICVVFPLDDIDVPRKDRANKYLQKSMCADGCDLKKMNFDSKEPTCLCPGASAKNGDLTFDAIKTNLLATLFDANFEVVFCYMLVFNSSVFPINAGSWLVLGLGIGSISTFAIFLFQKITPLSNYLKELKPRKPTEVKESVKNHLETNRERTNNHCNVVIYESKTLIKENGKNEDFNDKKSEIEKLKIKKNRNDMIQLQEVREEDVIQKEEKQEVIQKEEEEKQEKEKEEEGKILTTDEYEDLEYEELFKVDNRTYLRVYWNYLKGIHPFIDAFIAKNDKVLKLVKISNFLMSIILDLSLTALFYSDKYISNNLENDGGDFIYNLPVSIYTSLAGFVINTGLGFLAASESSISKIEKIEDAEQMTVQIKKFEKCYMIRVVIYYIFEMAFVLFFWYYVASFCAVYQNSQKEYVISCITSIAISMIIPFAICLVLAGIRKLGLKLKSKWILKILSFVTRIL